MPFITDFYIKWVFLILPMLSTFSPELHMHDCLLFAYRFHLQGRQLIIYFWYLFFIVWGMDWNFLLAILTLSLCGKIYWTLTVFFDKFSFTIIFAGQNKPVLNFPYLWILSLFFAGSSFLGELCLYHHVDKQRKCF